MANTIIGRLHLFTPEQTYTNPTTGVTRKSVTLVLDTHRYDPITGQPKYDNYPSFEVSEKYYEKCKNLKQGDIVAVRFDVKGRMYQDKNTGVTRYFNTLNAFDISKIEDAKEQSQTASQPSQAEVSPAVQSALQAAAASPMGFQPVEQQDNKLPF